MSRSLLLLNKPFQVLTQFTSTDGKSTLADYVSAPGLYPAGRLDYDSEGLVLLTSLGRPMTAAESTRETKRRAAAWESVMMASVCAEE